MNLVLKLAAAFVLGTFVVLTANGYFRARREIGVLQADRVRDHALLGRSLSAAVSGVWRSDGRADALRVVAGANEHSEKVHVRWVEGASAGPEVRADARSVAELGPGETFTHVAEDRRVSYTPVAVGGERVGFVELSESLETERRATRQIVADTLSTAATMVAVCGAMSIALSVLLVGRPVRALCNKARRVGEGDFSGPLALGRKDEFGTLANELNAMCTRLDDTTRRAERETAARIATLDQLRHADRLMTVGMLASGVAHELGTPLNVVSARAQMIASGDCSPEETADYARVIAEATERMTKIIRQLLAFARRKSPQKSPRDLARIAKDTCELLGPLGDRTQVSLQLHGTSREFVAEVDADGIQQALTNIVVNAIHAMPSGGTVDLSVAEEARPISDEHPGRFIAVRVKDNGAGIAKEHLARIFEPFFTTKDVGQGTGLGLSVTHGIVEDHGGFIDVTSEVGEGTVFTVHLPMKEPA